MPDDDPNLLIQTFRGWFLSLGAQPADADDLALDLWITRPDATFTSARWLYTSFLRDRGRRRRAELAWRDPNQQDSQKPLLPSGLSLSSAEIEEIQRWLDGDDRRMDPVVRRALEKLRAEARRDLK